MLEVGTHTLPTHLQAQPFYNSVPAHAAIVADALQLVVAARLPPAASAPGEPTGGDLGEIRPAQLRN